MDFSTWAFALDSDSKNISQSFSIKLSCRIPSIFIYVSFIINVFIYYLFQNIFIQHPVKQYNYIQIWQGHRDTSKQGVG